MSTGFYSTAIVGVNLKDVYTYEIKQETKTKYNENTGEPYEVPINRLYGKFLNKELPAISPDFCSSGFRSWSLGHSFSQDFSFLKEVDRKISVHVPGGCGNDPEYCLSKGIVGIELITDTLGRQSNKDGVPFSQIEEAFNIMRELLDQYDCKIEVRLFSQADGG
jgi:hypothetical protein